MKSSLYRVGNDEGFVLVTVMVVLILLTFLGYFATNTAMFELRIAGNDRVANETFYRADAGIQTGVELIEQNLSCPRGFSPITFIGGVDLYDTRFAYDVFMNEIAGATAAITLANLPSDTVRALRIPVDPANRTDNAPHTNIAMWGRTILADGSAIQQIAGYEGKAKGSAGGGAYIEYDIHSQHIGVVNSEAVITGKYRHMIGQEGTCNY